MINSTRTGQSGDRTKFKKLGNFEMWANRRIMRIFLTEHKTIWEILNIASMKRSIIKYTAKNALNHSF